MSIPLYLAFSPEETADVASAGTDLACMGYQLSPSTPALLAPEPLPKVRSMLLLQDDTAPSYRPTEALAQLIVEYAASCHTGLICDCDQPVNFFWQELIELLNTVCRRRRLPLWVPAAYAESAPDAWIMIGSHTVSGSFAAAMEQAAARYPGRCILELRPLSHLFALPCPDGSGRPLTPSERADLLKRAGGQEFPSPELCCRYFPMYRNEQPTLVLYDTAETLARKLRTAEEAGFQCAIGLYQELSIGFPHWRRQ